MFGPARSIPFRGLALVALGFLLASVLAGGGSSVGAAAGFLLFLPLLILKVLFFFFLFGALLRFAGGGWGAWGGPWHHRRHHGRGRSRPSGEDDGSQWWYRGRPMSPGTPARSPEEQEWEEHLRQARREVDDLDAPYRPDPGRSAGPRPPRPSGD